MSIKDILDKYDDIRVNITPEIEKAAEVLVDRYKDYYEADPTINASMNGTLNENTPGGDPLKIMAAEMAFNQAIWAFNDTVYEANPHLDPSKMLDSKGDPSPRQANDIERGSGNTLNDLITRTAKRMKKPVPFKIFKETNYDIGR